MGQLVAKAYRSGMTGKTADHTYVECGTGARGWGCWGGKGGGSTINSGTGSTERAELIAQPDERADITCYAINGVCHQAANRILLPASITVSAAGGYWVSNAMFGPYGRPAWWPCAAPFNQHLGVTGDLAPCAPPVAPESMAAPMSLDAMPPEIEDTFIRSVLPIYEVIELKLARRITSPDEIRAFSLKLFAHQIDFNLGEAASDANLRGKLLAIRGETEDRRLNLVLRQVLVCG
jgi:hypothetical protein